MSDAKKLKAMEGENGRLKKLLLDTLLDAAAPAGTRPVAWSTAKTRFCSIACGANSREIWASISTTRCGRSTGIKRTLSPTTTALMASPQAGETVAFEEAVGPDTADDRLDCGPSAQLSFDGRRPQAQALLDVDFARGGPVASVAFVHVDARVAPGDAFDLGGVQRIELVLVVAPPAVL